MRIFRLAVASIILFLAYCHITTAKENIAIEHSKNIPIERTILPIISYSGDSIMIDAPHSGTGKRVFEYFRDYQCPACTQFSRDYLPIIEQFARDGALQLVYRQYPLADLHQNAHRDALASLCAHEQGVYQEYTRKIDALESKKNWKTISDRERLRIFRWMGNAKMFRNCLKDAKYDARIVDDMNRGDGYHLDGIPFLILDGKPIRLDAFSNVATLESLLNERLQ